MHGRTILNTTFHTVLSEKRGGATEKKRDGKGIEAGDVKGGEGHTQTEVKCVQSSEEIA